MSLIPYNRSFAVSYAEKWALYRNPNYYDFSRLGGDCTNFVSQCVYAGSGVMNTAPETGWYYYSLNSRAPAWTGVSAFFRFLTENRGPGPFGEQVGIEELEPGDVVQLGTAAGAYYHSLLILEATQYRVYVAAHTNDALWRPLDSYYYDRVRCLHISGVRT